MGDKNGYYYYFSVNFFPPQELYVANNNIKDISLISLLTDLEILDIERYTHDDKPFSQKFLTYC